MGFPEKVKEEETLVNPSTNGNGTNNDYKFHNVEKETPDAKENPHSISVNDHVDKTELGKNANVSSIGDNAKFGFGIVVPNQTPSSPEGRMTGAGRTNFDKNAHSVVLMDHSKSDTKRYNFLVHCDTCGWEGRYSSEAKAKQVRDAHIDANRTRAA